MPHILALADRDCIWTLPRRALARVGQGGAVLSCAALLAGCAGPSVPAAPDLQLVAAAPSFPAPSFPAPSSSGSDGVSIIPVPLPLAIPAGPAQFPTGDLSAERRGAVSKTGKPYQVAGRWYTPRHDPSFDKTGVASWYGREFHGRKTANGEVFNSRRLTGAHPTLPLPSLVEVTNIANGKKVVIRLNDRGPYAHGRLIDVSQATAEALGFMHKGMTQVRVRYLGPAPLDGGVTQTASRTTASGTAAD